MENVERRLELVKMMRNEHKENIGRIQKREHILYPDKKVSYFDNGMHGNHNIRPQVSEEYQSSAIDPVSRMNNIGFYIRLGISISLFLLFFYMDMNHISYFGITCDMVQNMISDTFDLKSFAFMQ